jgi:nucleoside-diphosphate-sugar epimerase
MKKVLVCGAGGFIGNHLVNRLKQEGFWVCGVDLKLPQFSKTAADNFLLGDLRNQQFCKTTFETHYEYVYQLAADMGGAGYIFSGENDADVMYNSALINLNVLNLCKEKGVKKIFYSSSACVYPVYNQQDPDNPKCNEDSAYPAQPDSEYGWEKLFSERLYLSYNRNYNLQVHIARFHNIFGTESVWQGGKEKAPSALCRKIALAKNGDTIEVWGDGKQTRSFLFIDECIDGIQKLMQSKWTGPVNIGSEELISINHLAEMIIEISGKKLQVKNISGPTGVRGRNSDNKLIVEKLKWKPSLSLKAGIEKTYRWIEEEILKQQLN